MTCCQKLGKSASERFQKSKQAYRVVALFRSAVFKWHKLFVQGRESLEMLYELVGQQQSKLNPRSKMLQCLCVLTGPIGRWPRSSCGINYGASHKILSDDLNIHIHVLHNTMFQASWYRTNTTFTWPCEVTRSVVLTARWDFPQPDLSRRRNKAFYVWSLPEATIGYVEICIIYTKNRSKYKLMLELFFDSTGTVHLEFTPKR